LLVSLGDFEAGLVEAQRALELDPTSQSTGYTVELAYYFAREYETCVEVGSRLLEVDPEFHLIHSIIALCHERLGLHRDAVAAGREAVRLDESPLHKAMLVQVLASAGEQLSAETMLDELVETTEARYVCPYEIGLCHHVLGDTDTAIEWFERGYDARSDCWVWGNVDPRVDELREDERYRDLLRRVGHPVD
jgi:tetratricopeptide (TPR) repeat protein